MIAIPNLGLGYLLLLGAMPGPAFTPALMLSSTISFVIVASFILSCVIVCCMIVGPQATNRLRRMPTNMRMTIAHANGGGSGR